MRKAMALLLSVILLISVLPIAAGAEGETNVAKNRPGFAFRTYTNHNADYATDGDLTTAYQYNYKGRYYVDLGAAYTVTSIKLNLPSDFANYTVYLTNERQMSHGHSDFGNLTELVRVHDASTSSLVRDADGYVTIPTSGSAKYQFVCIAHTSNFILNEIEVYTNDTEVTNGKNGLPTYLVEVAAFKPAFATTAYGEAYMAFYANDRAADTSYLTDTKIRWQNDTEQIASVDSVYCKDMKQRFIIDLGAAYPIRAIVFRPASHPILSPLNINQTNTCMGGFSIYGTNDASLTVGDDGFDYIWGEAGNAGDYNYHVNSNTTDNYRYIVVESTAKAYSDGYNYHALGISDILVYTDTTSGVTAPDLGKETEGRTHIISRLMPTHTNGSGEMPTNADTLVDSNVLTPFEVSGASGSGYAFVDLGKPQMIDYVTLLDGNQAESATNAGNFIYVTNSLAEPFYDESRGDEILHLIPTAGTKNGVMELYEATSAMKEKKYRYVVYAIPATDGLAQGNLSQLDVYTKEENLQEVHTEIAISQGRSNLEFSVSADRFLSATNRNYTLIASSYDEDNRLINVVSKKIDLGYGVDRELSESIRLTSADGVSYVKVMLWDAMSQVRPIVENKTFILPEFTPGQTWLRFYVSPDGNDEDNGSETAPFKTLQRAQEEVRKYNQNMEGNIEVNLMPGRYELATHMEFKLEDSGSNGYEVIWQGTDPDNLPIVSGAKEVTGTWTEGEDGIWHTQAENLKFVREMFVNDAMAIRARSSKKIYGNAYYNELDSYNHPYHGEQTTKYVGFYADKSKIGLYENPEDVEIHSIMKFRTVLLHVDNMIQDPENENQVIVTMDRNFWNEYHINAKGKPEFLIGDGTEVAGNGFIVENAYELLDEPGEFYFNKKTKTLSYIPREGEDLNSAEILVPQTEQLLFVNGGNVNNRAHNIHFSNIKFAHATSFEMEESNIAGSQGEYHYANNTPWFMGRAAVLMDWAENVDFEACVFYGLSGIGLHHRDGIYNCDVVGNVFADLGATAFCSGAHYHDELIEPVKQEGPLDAAWHAPWSASYHYFSSAYTHQALNTQRYDEHSLSTGYGWHSEPWAKEEGTYPWLMLELEAAYALESFQFSFPKTATEEERSNFEVLISADRDFSEYKSLKTYTAAADFKETIEIGDGEKYRYIKLQKTVPGPFSLNGVWAWTYDRLEKGNIGVPEDCTVANNYFTRVAQQKQGSYPIWLNWTRGYEILHNTIDDAPYTGISVGWGWDHNPSTSAGDNKINYNRINDVMTYMDDGAGIYILGKNDGTEVRENYITNTVLDGMGVYFDQGTRGVVAADNVSVGTNEAFNLNTTRAVTLQGAYSADVDTFDAFGKKVVDPYNIEGASLEYHPITTFSINNPTDEVVRIMAEAGIEEEWSWIEGRVPEETRPRAILHGPDASDAKLPLSSGVAPNAYLATEKAIAQSMLDTGTFGPLPWHFQPETKDEIEYWLQALANPSSRTDDRSDGHLEEQFGLKAAVRKANDSVYHPSYEEMVAMCNEIANDAGNYPTEAMTTFANATAKIYAQNPQGRVDKAVAAVQLERAYEALAQQSLKTELVEVYVENAETVIDRENQKVTVKLPFGVELSDISPVITASVGSRVDMEKLDFSNAIVTVPVHNITLEETVNWTIEFEAASQSGKKGSISINADDWTGGNPNVQKSNTGDSITIEPWFQPTMNSVLMDETLSFSLKADRADTTNGIDIIFSGQTTNLQATTRANKNTYYKVKLLGQSMKLYKVVAGEEIFCKQVDNISFNYGQYNDFEISVTETSGQNQITIKLNGSAVLDASVSEPIGKTGYFGILTKNMEIKIKSQN